MKQSIKIFSKQGSDSNAACKVKELMHDLFRTEVENGQISIEKCTNIEDESQYYQTDTVVLVLDSEGATEPIQDQWAEKQELLKQMKPIGLIINVIYGDDSSKDLKDETILHEKWNGVFKFDDDDAVNPLPHRHYFSLCTEFNNFQKRKLRNYIRRMALFASFDSSRNILVVGTSEHKKGFRQYLDRYPFLQLRSNPSGAVSKDELFLPSNQESDDVTPLVSLYYPDEDTISTTTQRVKDKGEEEPSLMSMLLQILYSVRDGVYKYLWPSGIGPTFDRIFFLCDDGSSFKEIYGQPKRLSDNLAQCLESKDIGMSLEVLPVPVGDKLQTEEEKNSMAEIVKNFIERDHLENHEDLIEIFESCRTDETWFRNMYIMYLFHAGYKKDKQGEESDINWANARDLTDNPDAEKEIKQLIKIFTKLESYNKASQEVEKLLKDIFKEDVDRGKIFIEKYTDTARIPTVNYKTETVVVVLDARQTRVLITPRRRDAAVDQWNELQMLALNSKPNGSVIIVIYGDESSKGLQENQILQDKWQSVFKFNDEHAEYPLLQDRCFSLWENFNDFQRTALRNYMHELVLFPSLEPVGDVLVVGNDNQTELFREYLRRHPFLHLRSLFSEEHQGVTADELFQPSYENAVVGKSILRIYYSKTVDDMPIKVCGRDTSKKLKEQQFPNEDDLWNEVDGWLLLRSTRPGTVEYNGTLVMVKKLAIMISKYATSVWSRIKSIYRRITNALPEFERVILLCHDCDECFQKLCNQRDWVSDYATKCLESKYLRVLSDVLPLAVGERPKTKQEKDIIQGIMVNFSKSEYLEPYEKIKRHWATVGNDDAWLTKMYIMHLCHSGFQHNPSDDEFTSLTASILLIAEDDPNLQSSTWQKHEIRLGIEEAIQDMPTQ